MDQHGREQFIHLVRLAWELRTAGVGVSVKLQQGQEPFIEIPRAAGPLLVRASLQYNEWTFTWGRGRERSISALNEDAAVRISELAQNVDQVPHGSLG